MTEEVLEAAELPNEAIQLIKILIEFGYPQVQYKKLYIYWLNMFFSMLDLIEVPIYFFKSDIVIEI